jgi:hypothetical protein
LDRVAPKFLIRLSSLNVWLKNNQLQQMGKDALRRMLTDKLDIF